MTATTKNTVYTIRIALLPRSERTTKTTSGTLEELCEYFSNILEEARSYKKSISACADAQKIVDFLLMDTALGRSEKAEGVAA